MTKDENPEMPEEPAGADKSIAQTLSRGLMVLEVLAEAEQPMTAQEIARALHLKRPSVYRILKTLERHQLLSSPSREGYYELGLGVLKLSRNVRRNVRQAAYPIIRELADRIGTTVVLGQQDGEDVVYVLSIEAELARMAVRSREGARRPIGDSTSGLALRMTWPFRPDDDDELLLARKRGFAARDRVMGFQATAISAPVPDMPGPSRACVTALFPTVIDDIEDKGLLVVDAARRVGTNVPLTSIEGSRTP